MKILQLNITEFGCIKDKIIEPSGELNIIYGENESGKSTLLLFIKFMLYGLTRRSATNSERERSISWSGHRAAGSMTISVGDKTYRIERSFVDGTRTGNETLSVLCIDDGSIVKTEKSPGEYFLGVPREAFEGSACVGQMRSAEINGEKVAASIENMLSAADESVDTAKILKNLDLVRVGYRHKNKSGGSLFDDEQKINNLRSRIERAKENSASLEEWERKIEQSKRDRDIIVHDFEQKDALLGELNKVTVLKGFESVRAMQGELELAKAELAACESSLVTDGFMPDRAHTAEIKLAAKDFAAAQRLCESKAEQCEAAKKVELDESAASLGEQIEEAGGAFAVASEFKSAKNTVKKQHGVIVASVSVAAAFSLGSVAAILLWSIIGAAGFSILPIAAILTVLASRKKSAAKKKAANLCSRYGTDKSSFESSLNYFVSELAKLREARHTQAILDGNLKNAEKDLAQKYDALRELMSRTKKDAQISIEAAAEEYKRLESLISERESALRKIDTLDAMLKKESAALEHYDEKELREAISVDIDLVTPQAISEAERERAFLAEKLRVINTRISGLENLGINLRMSAEDPMPLSDELADLEEKHRVDSEFYDALTLAMESIESAADAMRGSVTPVISRQASEIMDKLSGGKYPTLRTTNTLGVSLDKDGYAIKSDLLSSGTRDAAYISLRLALFMRIFENELPPLIFDESLTQLDDTRAERMMLLLGRLGTEGVQTLLFTSHSREREIAERSGIAYNQISL